MEPYLTVNQDFTVAFLFNFYSVKITNIFYSVNWIVVKRKHSRIYKITLRGKMLIALGLTEKKLI